MTTFIGTPNTKLARYLPWIIGFILEKPLYSLRSALSSKENTYCISAISIEMQKVSAQTLSFRIEQIFKVDASDVLKKCDVPIMYFRGTKDWVVPEKNMDKILRIRPDTQVVKFNTQHFLLQSCPEKAWAHIQKFSEACLKQAPQVTTRAHP